MNFGQKVIAAHNPLVQQQYQEDAQRQMQMHLAIVQQLANAGRQREAEEHLKALLFNQQQTARPSAADANPGMRDRQPVFYDGGGSRGATPDASGSGPSAGQLWGDQQGFQAGDTYSQMWGQPGEGMGMDAMKFDTLKRQLLGEAPLPSQEPAGPDVTAVVRPHAGAPPLGERITSGNAAVDKLDAMDPRKAAFGSVLGALGQAAAQPGHPFQIGPATPVSDAKRVARFGDELQKYEQAEFADAARAAYITGKEIKAKHAIGRDAQFYQQQFNRKFPQYAGWDLARMSSEQLMELGHANEMRDARKALAETGVPGEILRGFNPKTGEPIYLVEPNEIRMQGAEKNRLASEQQAVEYKTRHDKFSQVFDLMNKNTPPDAPADADARTRAAARDLKAAHQKTVNDLMAQYIRGDAEPFGKGGAEAPAAMVTAENPLWKDFDEAVAAQQGENQTYERGLKERTIATGEQRAQTSASLGERGLDLREKEAATREKISNIQLTNEQLKMAQAGKRIELTEEQINATKSRAEQDKAGAEFHQLDTNRKFDYTQKHDALQDRIKRVQTRIEALRARRPDKADFLDSDEERAAAATAMADYRKEFKGLESELKKLDGEVGALDKEEHAPPKEEKPPAKANPEFASGADADAAFSAGQIKANVPVMVGGRLVVFDENGNASAVR